ncbi:P-loop NTPase fold protein [Prochlorococcus marinus]|jgi:hypothetical protein|uniref:KAP NTPase domain-containing protein n=1 Tax=Prochlorococcus marinus (strain MIT 9301) TaxID=167546 RepID=A3PE86_PROM0|nr:P-loop NTPase fold protein [Prochlorococcus marinus]ABO18061.1 Hypothetical protein P9301_14381 [Prochlorococcus marinus str. MIT 9301]
MNKDFIIIDKPQLAELVIIIDGYWGSGKSLLFALIDDLRIFEKSIIDETIEHALALNYCGEISDLGLKTIINQRKDLLIFNNQIARCSNIRLSDLTGPRNFYDFFRIIKDSFKKYNSKILSRKIISGKINLPIMIHCSVGSLNKLLELYGEKLYYSHSSRNPIDVFEHTLEYYINLYDNPSMFDILLCKSKDKLSIPWFLKSIEKDIYDLIGNSFEELTLLTIATYTRILIENKKKFDNHKNIKFVDFDKLVSSPELQIFNFNKHFLNKEKFKKIKYKKYNLPRNLNKIRTSREENLMKIKNLSVKKEILNYFLNYVEIYEKEFDLIY